MDENTTLGCSLDREKWKGLVVVTGSAGPI